MASQVEQVMSARGLVTIAAKDVNRFWSNVAERPEVGCWLWVGPTFDSGYGRFRLGGADRRAHRVSWLIATGEWPTLHVLHHCDTPACVRFIDLFLGTHADNMADMKKKGRYHLSRAKLGPELRDYVRSLRGVRTQREIAQELGVAHSTVGNVQTGRTWNGD
jgi:hypothetical protein